MGVRNVILQSFLIFSFCSHLSEQFKFVRLIFEHILEVQKRCNCKCGISTYNQNSPRLLSGVQAYPTEFPWIAIIHQNGKYITSGSLINDRYVLTGASKIYSAPQSMLKITLNKFHRNRQQKQELTIGILSIIFHPGFTSDIDIHDLALIRLVTNVGFRFPLIPICLPRSGASYNNKVAVVANYKSENVFFTDDADDDFLYKLELPILPKKRCTNKAFAYEDCIGIPGIEELLCQNDSGAGVQYETARGYFELIGVMTAKQSCTLYDALPATSTIPIMTTVQYYLGWIYENTKDACYCKTP